MALTIYNTLTGKKEPLKPVTAGEVRMYVCGVTVYDYSHVGHARSQISFDVLYRYLQHQRFKVTYVRNVTDIDDNIINRSTEKNIAWRELTAAMTEAFDEDMRSLSVKAPTKEPKATEHIADMIAIVEALIRNGKAYHIEGGDVYFSVPSHEGYGKLSNRKLEDMRGKDGGDPDKRHPADFALWKAEKPGEPSWDSPWGKGRPGWHIECSAMSSKYLGQPFDIHGGGNDLVFPHHENEIAQSEGSHEAGAALANIWMHNGMLTVDDEKMSKSLGNFFTIREVLEKYEAEALRMLFLSAHYRSPCNFSDVALDESTKAVERMYRALAEVEARQLTAASATLRVAPAEGPEVAEANTLLEGLADRFRDAMDDDLNTPQAIGALFEVARMLNRMKERKRWTTGDSELANALATRLKELGGVLGFLREAPQDWLGRVRDRQARAAGLDPKWVEAQIADRVAARKSRDWTESDRIRDALKEKGVLLQDLPGRGGTTWQFRKP